MHLLTNGRNTSIQKSQNADTTPASARQQTALWQSDNDTVNLFAHWLEVRRMQSAFFVLPDYYISPFFVCQYNFYITFL